MKAMNLLPLGLALAATMACTPVTDTEVASAGSAAGQSVELAAGGLTTGSVGLHHANIIEFGQPRAAVFAQLSPILGRPETGRNPDCPTGPVETASFGELSLIFEEGRFTGWMIDGAKESMLQSRNGLSVGDQRIDIDADAEVEVDTSSTLGTELSVDGIGALLSGPGELAEIETLFAGRTCFAR